MIPQVGALVTVSRDGTDHRGQILEIVSERPGITLRIRWEDGRETRIDPAMESSLKITRGRLLRPKPGRRDSRTFLLKSLPKNSVGAEVGVWKGDFAAEMLRIVRPYRLYLIDPWEFMPDPHHAHTRYGGSIAKSTNDMETVFRSVCKRFGREISKGTVNIHRGTLLGLAETLKLPVLDWVYIDGDHNYDAVSSDLQAAVRMVRPGGYITGDDYREDGWWKDSVISAVHELMRDGVAELELVKRSQYILRRLDIHYQSGRA